jgi:signal transduction histidine kinase
MFSVLASFTNLVVLSTKNMEWGTQIASGRLGIIYNISSILIVVGILIIILRKYQKSSRADKQKISYFLLGVGVFSLAEALFTLVFPFLNLDKYSYFGDYSIIIFFGLTSYAIVKHRLMDIRTVVARSVSYTFLLIILAALYIGTILGVERILFPGNNSTFAQSIIRTLVAVVLVFLFQPIRKLISKVTDKIFFKNQYNSEELLNALAHTISATIVLIELVYKTLDLLMIQMKITRGMFVILNETGTVYNAQASGYKESPEVKQEDIVKLAKDGILIYDELEEGSHYKALLRKYDAAAAIPLKTENTTEGLILLGEKESGDMFSAGDLKVFEIIAPEIAVAVTNAKSFEKIEKFNVTLRQEVKKATSELEKKNEQLRELDKAKDEFISMASHQLRTPLTAIKGYLSMLLEGDAGEIKVSQYDFVNEAFSGANRMVGLINDLLNVSRMETGRFFLEPVEVDMEKLVTEEVKQLENHAKEKKLYLKYVPKGKLPHVWVDETKMRQVVMNFIDNALYYTTQGGVTVTLEQEKKDIIFKVTDTGIGVPKEAQKSLFTKFYRADNARHVRPDGTGLGIYLAKRVMDDHNGEIIFHSEEGKGSMFGFKLPIKSKLAMKRISAPIPEGGATPAAGELAAGIGVPPETLGATTLPEKKKVIVKVTKG